MVYNLKSNSVKAHRVALRQAIVTYVIRSGTMKKIMCTCFFLLIFPHVAMSDGDRHHGARSVIHGIAVTGINDLLGSPIGPGPAFQLLGEYDPDPLAEAPLPLTPDTSNDAILATRYPLVLLSFFNIIPGVNDYPDDQDNVPLHENPIPVAFSIYNRAPVAPASVATALEPSRRDENPITLGDWLDARGKAYIRCSRNGSRASVSFLFWGLVDNGLYTLWAVPSDGSLPNAFGGVPNVFTADRRGSAFVHRTVAYCPTDGQLLDITAAYHSDGMVYANFPDATFDGFTSGIVAHDHVVFPLQ